jgi:hypothetical protein
MAFHRSTLLSAMGVFNLIGTTNAGWLADKYDNRMLLCIYCGLRGLSLMCLPFAFASIYTMAAFAVLYGLCWFAAISPTVKLIGAVVGRERAGMAYGWAFIAHQIGGRPCGGRRRIAARPIRQLHRGLHALRRAMPARGSGGAVHQRGAQKKDRHGAGSSVIGPSDRRMPQRRRMCPTVRELLP